MIILTLSAPLATLLPEQESNDRHRRQSIRIDANSWTDAVSEISRRFQRLANHVFDESGQLRRGFLAAINDNVSSRSDGPPRIDPGDEIFLFAQIAGG